jgi:hypothetical protein
MARHDPFTLQMQITRMYSEGQSFFATIKVQEWLKERKEDPAAYDIVFIKQPAPLGSGVVHIVQIQLKRRDGEPVSEWLQQEINRWN